MKRYIYIALILGVTQLNAQVKDSLSYNSHDVESSLFFNLLSRDLSGIPANYSFYHINNYTASSLYFVFEDGLYKQGGEPETIKQFGIKTNGLYKNKKGLTFFGSFAVEKSFYNNLKWNLSYELPVKGLMPDPHYFLVSKGAKWNNQNYGLDGGVLVPLTKRWEWMIKVDYSLFNKYRTDYDPRPKVTFNSLGFTSGVSYQFADRHFVKIGGEMGYSHIDNEVNFSNNNHNIPGNYDIYVRWMSGYGSLTNTVSSSTMRRNKWTSWYVGHAYKAVGWTLLTDFTYRKDKNITYVRGAVKDYKDRSNYFARYTPETISATVLGIVDLARESFLKFKLSGSAMSANNMWYSKGGKTYVAKCDEINLNIGYLKPLSLNASLDAGVFLTYWDLNQRDALSTTYSRYSNMEIGGHVMRSFELGKNMLVSPIVKSRFRLNTDAEFAQGNTDYLNNIGANDFAGYTLRGFYDEVVYPDYELFSNNELDISIGTLLRFKTSARVNTQFNFDLGFKKPFGSLQYFQEEHPVRYYGMMGLTLYY
ncbi:DUF6850 family outer membrane beta-barrel protein [Sinomicrobium sp.]